MNSERIQAWLDAELAYWIAYFEENPWPEQEPN